MEELKPCPFCGGDARIAMGSYDTHSFWVYCRPSGHSDGHRYKSEHEAAKAWNTRHEPTCENCHTEGTIRISGKYDAFQCSKCGWDGIINDDLVSKTYPKFCPNCGAKVVDNG